MKLNTLKPPFAYIDQLDASLNCSETVGDESNRQQINHLPGHPAIPLGDEIRMSTFLEKDLWSSDLERLAPKLWVLSTQSSANINPLHHQRVKGRDVIPTEDPRLHLVWIYDRIFIKPLPRYLLSHAFWTKYLLPSSSPLGSRREKIYTVALGFLRTYYHLIQHETDLVIAQQNELRLIPKDVSWERFCCFISKLREIPDDEVWGRYHYGELRLTRLNFYAKLFLNRFHYEQLEGQYNSYFGQFYSPLLFIFGLLSVILNAMQVGTGVESLVNSQWEWTWQVYRWVSALSLIVTGSMTLILCSLWLRMFVAEWVFALGTRRRKQMQKTKAKANNIA